MIPSQSASSDGSAAPCGIARILSSQARGVQTGRSATKPWHDRPRTQSRTGPDGDLVAGGTCRKQAPPRQPATGNCQSDLHLPFREASSRTSRAGFATTGIATAFQAWPARHDPFGARCMPAQDGRDGNPRNFRCSDETSWAGAEVVRDCQRGRIRTCRRRRP